MGDDYSNGTASATVEPLKAERADLEKTVASVRQMARDFDTLTERRKSFDAKRVAFHLQLKGPHLRRCIWKGFFTPEAFQWHKAAIARKKALGEQMLKDTAAYCQALVRWAEDLEKRESQHHSLETAHDQPAGNLSRTGANTLSPNAPTDQQIADEITALTLLLERDRAAALDRNARDCISNRPAEFVKWGSPEEWSRLDFLKKVQLARKELGPNGYGTWRMSSVLNTIFGDTNEEILRYFEPAGGYLTTPELREQMNAIATTAAVTTSLALEALSGPEELLFAKSFANAPEVAETTTSLIPESYINSRYLVNMEPARSLARSKLNASGQVRNADYFWQKLIEREPRMFSEKNLDRIQKLELSPKVDSAWVEYNPAHQGFINDVLDHHHFNQGRIAVPLPQTVHQRWTSVLHGN